MTDERQNVTSGTVNIAQTPAASKPTMLAAVPQPTNVGAWRVGAEDGSIEPVDQTASATYDKQPDENWSENCGEASSCSLLTYYYKLNQDGTILVPDQLKDWAFGQGIKNVLSYDSNISSMLAHFGGIPTVTQVPVGKQNGHTGVLDRMYQALYHGVPVVWAGYWMDPYTRTIYTSVGHWRLVWKMTSTQVTAMDPYGGFSLTMTWDECYRASQQVLVVPTVTREGVTWMV